MLKKICFDIGNVLCHVKLDKFTNSLSRKMNISKEDALIFLYKIQKSQDLGLSNVPDELIRNFNIKSELIVEDLVNDWNSTLINEQLMIDAIKKLLEAGYEIALLSNMGSEHYKTFKKNMPNEVYDNVIKHLSCYVGARKPSMLYYQSFLMQYPEFKGAVYLDDIEENLAMGKKVGLKPFYMNLETLENKLSADGNNELSIKDYVALKLKRLGEVIEFNF